MEYTLKKIIGTIVEDPAKSAVNGRRMEFSYKTVATMSTVPIGNMMEWHSFEGILLALMFKEEKVCKIEGSGVLVGPGIAIVAKHVLDPYFIKMGEGKSIPYCFGLTSNGMQIWKVNEIACVSHQNDLAILTMTYCAELPPANHFNLAKISTRLAKLGETLFFAGFRALGGAFEFGKEFSSPLTGDVFLSTGIVTQQFPNGRGGLLPGPCIEIDCPALGGMSGGPVFDADGLLVGILSTSYEGDGPSYATLIWPCLPTKFKGGWPNSLFAQTKSLLDLQKQNCCFIDKPEALDTSTLNADGLGDYFYKPW
jgi:Trypsin-like peptidase domain